MKKRPIKEFKASFVFFTTKIFFIELAPVLLLFFRNILQNCFPLFLLIKDPHYQKFWLSAKCKAATVKTTMRNHKRGHPYMTSCNSRIVLPPSHPSCVLKLYGFTLPAPLNLCRPSWTTPNNKLKMRGTFETCVSIKYIQNSFFKQLR